MSRRLEQFDKARILHAFKILIFLVIYLHWFYEKYWP